MQPTPSTSTTSTVHTSSNTVTPAKKPRDRLARKLEGSKLASPQSPPLNWDTERVVTPGGMCGYQSKKGVQYIDFDGDGSVKLFRSGKDSQGLISLDGQVVAASVTSDITSATQRKQEKKGTFIQYDKTRVKTKDKDFEIDPKNYRGWVNYQGGHLIDHKFSAGTSHYHEENYIPMHYFYNAPLKEYLVQRCDAYIEIPLYTSNPPSIGVKGDKGNYHLIPVGIIFVQITGNKIKEVYYFPNNNFDYKGLTNKLGLKKDLAANIAPYFKLDESLYPLLRSAMIIDIAGVKDGTAKQEKKEEKFFDLMDDVSFGMSLEECSEDQEAISQFSFSVLHKKGVDPSFCLSCDEKKFKNLDGQPLTPPFNALGDFLVKYGIRNALKSETLSIKSRLIFANVVIDFIEAYSQVSEEAFDFVDSLANEFTSTLDELQKIVDTMDLEELTFLATTFERLSSPFCHEFVMYDYGIHDGNIEVYLRKLIEVLKVIDAKHKIESLDGDAASNFLNCIKDAQKTLEYLLETGYPKEIFTEVGNFLKEMCSKATALFDSQEKPGGIYTANFQSNVNRTTVMKANVDYIGSIFENLGMSDSDSEASSLEDSSTSE